MPNTQRSEESPQNGGGDLTIPLPDASILRHIESGTHLELKEFHSLFKLLRTDVARKLAHEIYRHRSKAQLRKAARNVLAHKSSPVARPQK